MDLLETVLRTAKAEGYLEKFRDEGIEARSLKLLTEEDLELLGIDDLDARNSILKQSQNLLFAKETKIDTCCNRDYVKLVLLHMASQLNLYNATLTCIVARPDIINCDIQLTKASAALSNAINDLHAEIVQARHQVLQENGISDAHKKSQNKRIVLKGVLISVFLVTNFYVLKMLVL